MSRILIIDDEEGVRSELKERIDSMGHESEEAECVENALKLIQEMAFDCILLDLAIPVKFEGVARVDHGKNLLQRIVSMENPVPVIVVTANHKSGHKVAVECIELGAHSFVSKNFEEDPVEPKIRRILDGAHSKRNSQPQTRQEFSGGVILFNEDCIELCGEEVGGTKGNALIRQILPHLARRTKGDRYIKATRGDIASAIKGDVMESGVANAIKDFREKCRLKLGCGPHDVIVTHRGGGYQLADWITFQIGSEERVQTQAESDQATVMKELRRFKERTRRQISDRTGIPQLRIKTALSKLDDNGKLDLKGSGNNTRYFIRELKA